MTKKSKSAQEYKIGEFARKAGVPVSTVNYYVKQGLIQPQATTPSGYRIFSEDGLRTVSTIRELQTEYLPLDEIKKQLRQKGRLRGRLPQMSLPFEEFELAPVTFRFPSTRYQGSKLKLVEWIWQNIKHLRFETALDAFGGTGCVAYMLKTKNKEVTYNDILRFNHYIGLALIENDKETLSSDDLRLLLTKHKGVKYPTFIYDAFHDIYFTDEENSWLDMVVRNIQFLKNRYKQALAYYALFQACIIKRPYNLFHRKNLYIRTAEVKRSFGNKITWDTPFAVHFVRFVEESNESVFSNGRKARALNLDVFDMDGQYDLVYIDTPYISSKGVGVDYLEFYHFLEGIVNYDKWSTLINHKVKHKSLEHEKSLWTDKNRIHDAFDRLFHKFRDSILVVSYRSDGVPTDSELMRLLRKYKRDVVELNRKDYKYVLSNNGSEELLFVAA